MNQKTINNLFEKARNSQFYLSILNFLLARYIPFNAPHKFQIKELSTNHIRVFLPNIRKNQNHIRGIHACALATLCEFATGLLLISRLDMSKYRLIMKTIKIDYHFQAKKNVYVEFHITDDELKTYQEDLEKDSIEINPVVKVIDIENNHICTANVNWHLKNWANVKTKV